MKNLSSSSSLNPSALRVVLSIFFIFGILAITYIRPLLPPKYDFDAIKIRAIASRAISTPNDNSFQLVGELYAFFGLENQPLVASYIGLLVYFAFIFYSTKVNSETPLTITTIAFIGLMFVCGVVFLGTYSKEFFLTIALFLFFAFIQKNRHGAAFLVLLFYGLNFRTYWIAVAVIWALAFWMYVRYFKKFKISTNIIALVLALVTAMPIVALAFGYRLSSLRSDVNMQRAGSEVAFTAINDFLVSDQPFIQAINFLIITATLIIPLPLMLLGDPIYVFFGLAITSIWLFLFSALRNENTENKSSAGYVILIAVYLSIQTFFEPDYGSFLRHLAPFLPIFLYLYLKSKSPRKHSDGKK